LNGTVNTQSVGYGDETTSLAEVPAFVEEMSSAGADSQVIVYSGTMHGFTHEDGGNKTAGAAYHPIADARSRSAMRSFCNELFPGPIGPG
jgi:dienelactone hydrolase